MRILATLLLLAVAAACDADDARAVTVRGTALAGPSCPVVSEPPDPACADRPVAGAEIVVRDEAGEAIARVRTAEDGTFAVSLVPGGYTLVPQPVEGLLGTAPEVEFEIVEGIDPAPLTVVYDTGIR